MCLILLILYDEYIYIYCKMQGLFQPILVVSVAKGVSQANNLHYSINLAIYIALCNSKQIHITCLIIIPLITNNSAMSVIPFSTTIVIS